MKFPTVEFSVVQKCLDTEGRRNIVNFLNISQYLRFKLQFKVSTVAKTLMLEFFVFAICFVVKYQDGRKEQMGNGQWRCFFKPRFFSCCLVLLYHSDVLSALKTCLSLALGLLVPPRKNEKVRSVGAEASNKRQNGEEAILWLLLQTVAFAVWPQ